MSLLRQFIREVLEQPSLLPKGEWFLLTPDDPRREVVKSQLYDMVCQTYAPIGGHFKVCKPGDLDRYAYWVVQDIDEDPEIDVAMMGKPQAGVKFGAGANDGSPAAASAYKNKSAELRSGGSVGGVGNWWGEVSGKPAYAMIKRGARVVEDEAIARQLMPGDDFVWHGEHPEPVPNDLFRTVNGWYTKRFGDKHSTKIILGVPAL